MIYWTARLMKICVVRRNNMFPYIPVTPEDEKKMLDSIGLNSLDDLFSDIPESIKT